MKTMKKQTIIFILLLFSIISFAQMVNTEVPIIGLREFELGMTKRNISDSLKKLTSADPEALKYSNYFISAPNLNFMGSNFDHCVFFFDEKMLYSISFTKYFDNKEECSEEFERLLHTLEESYGVQLSEGNKEYTWKRGHEHIQIVKGHDPMKDKESVSIYCSTSDLYSSLAGSRLNMYGLGEFVFFSSAYEVEAAMKNHITPSTKIKRKKKLFSSEVKTITLTNIMFAGYLFDYCELNFIENELCYIIFEMYFDKNNKNPKEFEALLAILEGDYGKPEKKEGKESFSWDFNNDTTGWLWFRKFYNQNTKRNTISIYASRLF